MEWKKRKKSKREGSKAGKLENHINCRNYRYNIGMNGNDTE